MFSKINKIKRLLVTNQLLNVVLDTSSLILPQISSNGPFPAACGKGSNLENVEAMPFHTLWISVWTELEHHQKKNIPV